MYAIAFGGIAALCLAGGAIAAQGAHEHGRAQLEVAIDGAAVHVGLEGPLESFVGFEHRPRTADERERLAGALAVLRAPSRWLALPADAGCAPGEARVADPFDGHQPASGDANTAHSDLRAEVVYSCAAPERLTRIELRLFQHFKRLHELRAQVAGPAGQALGELTAGSPVLKLR